MNHEKDLVTREIRPECEWALSGEAKITIKHDGTAAAFINGKLHKRYDRKLAKKFARKLRELGSDFLVEPNMFKVLPEGAIPCEPNPDPITFHHPHWVPVGEGNEDKFFKEGLENTLELNEGDTFELVGPKLQGNIYGLEEHVLLVHGDREVTDIELTFDGIKNWLRMNNEEGLVFHHPDGRMCKIRRKDMFDFVVKPNGRKIDWRDGNIILD